MVYDSDFYTTRRTYTRPLSPHYTVTAVNRLPHIIPYVAHKKLATYIPYPVVYYTHHAQLPIRIYSSVRPSVLEAELRRIRNLQRTSNLSYVSRYLNSKDNIMFDDEARGIRATADSLLRKIHVFVPRPATSDFAEVIVPERMRSDDYIKRVLTSRKNLKKSDERDARHFGNGNLACVSYTAGKSHSRRRPYFKVADLRPADVQSDINLLSYYTKNRQAAASALPDLPLTDRELRKARALAEDRVYSIIRQASPDPEPVKRKDLAKVFEPVVQPDPEPIVEAQSEPVKELVSDPFRERKPISRKITKSERRSEPDIPIKSEPIVELELSPVVEPVFEGNIESLLEPIVVEEGEEEAATAAASVVESEPKSDVEAKQEPLAELESEQFVELEPEQFAEIESESFAELKPESEPFEDVEQEPEPVAESELEPEYVAEPEYVSEPEPENHNELTQDSFLEFKSRQPDEELGFNFEEEEEEEELTDRPEDEAAIVEPSDSIEPEIMPDLITNSEPGDLTKKIDESDVWPVRPESRAESDEAEEEVLQRKLDEDDLRRQVEELKRQAEEEKRKQAEEARLADERWKAEIEEKKRLEEEARQARFREIEEQERLEAARQKEEARIERERVRDEQIATEQRRAAEYEAAVAQEEEERFVIEKASEEARKRQENEEKLASEVASSIIEEPTALDSTSDECHCHDNVNSHDGEERVDSPDADDDTQIEEEAACMSPDQDEVSEYHVYDGENEGYNN